MLQHLPLDTSVLTSQTAGTDQPPGVQRLGGPVLRDKSEGGGVTFVWEEDDRNLHFLTSTPGPQDAVMQGLLLKTFPSRFRRGCGDSYSEVCV